MSRLKGLINFVFDMVDETTGLVERTHMSVIDRSVGHVPPVEPVESVANEIGEAQKVIAQSVYQAVRGVNEGVRMLVNGVTAPLEDLTEMFADAPEFEHDTMKKVTWGVDQLQAFANGYGGHYFRSRNNPLEIQMHLRVDGQEVPLTKEALQRARPNASPKVAVLVHGLACTEWVWGMKSDEFYGDAKLDFAQRLENDCGYTSLYVRYNSGRPIAESAQDLNELLQALTAVYPVEISEIVLLGHSMGGLVIRGAAHRANIEGNAWVNSLKKVFCIGSPHLGLPVEQSANALGELFSRIPTAATEVIGEIFQTRSDGIKDLRYGYTVEEGKAELNTTELSEGGILALPCVDGVAYYSLAATLMEDPEHPVSRFLGDWLVRLPSAKGEASTESLAFDDHKFFGGMNHIALANHPSVYDTVRGWLES